MLGLHRCTQAFSSCGEWGHYSLAVVHRLLSVEHRLQAHGFTSYSTWVQSLWCLGLVAPQHVESS